MTETGASPRRGRIWKYCLLALAAGLVLLGAAAWYTTTDSFQGMVRRRLVAELERVTGGRVDLDSIHTIPFRFQVDVRNLTIHGRESANQVPYAHVDRLVAQVKLISVLGAEFGFRSLVLQGPVIHIIVYPDGTTNQPQPQVRSDTQPVEKLFSFSISRLEVRKGALLWNDQKLPLDFAANDISASLDYSILHQQYEGDLLLGKVDTQASNFRPVAWMMEAHFALSQNSLVVHRMRATSGRSALETSGRWGDFRTPKFDGNYRAVLDLAEAGAVLRRPEFRRGTIQVEGNGVWSTSDSSSAGKLAIKDLDWRDETFRIRSAALDTQFTVNTVQIALSQIHAQLLGGEVTGQAEVTNWRERLPSGKPAKRAAEQKGSVSLRMKDVQIGEVAAALATPARPLDRLRLAGSTSGTIETRWTGSLGHAETNLAVDVAAPPRPSAAQLPLTMHGSAVYRGDSEELEIRFLDAATRATEVNAKGTLSSRAAMRVSVHTTDLSEWQTASLALGYQEQIPVTLQGHASFEGTASGKLSAIQFSGKMESQDFDFLIPATLTAPRKQVSFDALAADIQVSPSRFAVRNGILRQGSTTLRFDGSAALEGRRFTSSSPFNVRLNIQDADVSELLSLAGLDLPVSGTANFSLQANGTKASPQGQGRLEIANAVVRGQSVPHFESALQFEGEQVTLGDVKMVYHDAPITGAGSYDFSSHASHFSARGTNFDLQEFSQLQTGGLNIEGKFDFNAEGRGTLEAPALNATLHLHGLTLDHELAGDYTLNAVTQGSEMRLTGRSAFKDAELNFDGNVRLRDDWPAELDFHFDHLDVDALLRTYLRGHITGRSAVVGDVQLSGPLRNPRDLQVTGNLSGFSADVEHVEVRNNGPIRFTLADRALHLQQFRLSGQGTDLSVTGSLQLDDDHHLNLRANGNAGLQLIESFNPDFTTSGTVAMDVEVGGTIARPVLQGRLQVNHGSVAYADLPSALSDLNGSLVFNQDRLQIETLTGHVGGGAVSFGGYAAAYSHQLSFDLTLQGRDVRLRYPLGVSSMMNADLRFAGTPSASTLSGDATITKLAVTPGFDFGGYLASTSQGSALPQTNPLLNRIRMDVHIVTLPELQMQTASLRLSGDADLQLRGTAAKPVLLGRADVIEGQVYFNGQKYRMERGEVTFTNPVTSTPVLDLQASTRVKYYDITVNLNGEFDKLNLTYHSEPPLPSSDIISLLALGQTREQSAQLQQNGQQSFAQQASSAALAEALNAALSSRSRSLFGISHIKVDPQGLNTETSPTTAAPAVTIEQQVKDNLTLTYTTNVSQTSQQIIQAEYNINHNVSILGIRDYNGVVSFEVRIRQRKK